MASKNGKKDLINDLLYQALETELGGMDIYKKAISCAVNKDLKKEWKSYLEETMHHRDVLMTLFSELDLDPEVMTPSRDVARHLGESLIAAMDMAKASGDPLTAQLVAAECVVLAETKDHANWEMIGFVSEKTSGKKATLLKQAYDEVEEDEDHHLYHTQGWKRELWIETLGFPALVPPPEETKEVESAIGAARAKNAREKMLSARKH